MKLMSTEVANHFLGLGLPYPHMMLKLVILIEMVCGMLIAANKAVKNAVVPLIGIMIVALLTTKNSLGTHRIPPIRFCCSFRHCYVSFACLSVQATS